MRSTCRSPSSAIKMATFNPKAFERKLNAMDLSQTSVQTVSLWIIHHKQNIKEIIAVWIEMMKKAKMDRKLVLLYLANDVVQNSRKKAKDLIVYFGKAFKETFPYLNDKKINSQVERVVKIWDERRVYEKDFLEKLRAVHTGGGKKEKAKVPEAVKIVEKPPEKISKPKTPIKPLPDDFKMSAVMNMIVSMKELESELSMQDNQMTSLKVDDLEAVKQVKDRSGVNKFVKEFEDSKEKLDAYCNKLSRCINDKRVLIDMLHHSETYYDAAYEEAKVIVHAYKTFGSRLSSMKRKVESKVKKLKVQWQEKQKEIEEQKNAKPEYELEPISDAEEPSEFQAIGDLVQSGLKSLAAKQSELYEPEDPTVDNTDVLDMDLGSDSEAGTPDGPLYDPGSVMYDPNDVGKDFGDTSQQSIEDGENSNPGKINIPNPEDVFKNIVGQPEMSTSSLFKPMGIMIDGKLQTVSLSEGNMIIGSEDKREKSVIQRNAASTVSTLPTETGKRTSSMVATEPSGSLLNNEAVSPISEDSVPSPEGTPEGLVLEKDGSQDSSLFNQSALQQQDNFSNVMASTMSLPTVMHNNQFIGSDQFVMVGNDNWSMGTSTAPMSFDQAPLGTMSDLPPPPIMQTFPGMQGTNTINFEQPMQGLVGDQGSLSTTFLPMQQSTGLIDQFQVGAGPMGLTQPSMQMQDSLDPISVGASTTPTQDESIEEGVRPIDILSQLLSKGKKPKKDSHSDKDRTHSDRDKEHRSKDHNRHKKSSRRKSADRHHSTDLREASNERPESSHASSKRSHHRRKSRGHSKEKQSSYPDDKSERREGSIETFDDSSGDFYSRSPKISRMQSFESYGEPEESNPDRKESADGRNASRISDAVNESSNSNPVTIFDQRRSEKKSKKMETANELAHDDSQHAAIPSVEVMKGNTTDAITVDFSRQYSTGSDVFLDQQKSSEGQVPMSQTEFQQNMSQTVGMQNAEQWTPTSSAPQKPMEYYFDSRRSPTPELDRYQGDVQLNQQTQFMAPAFQQTSSFGTVSQFDPQANVLYSEAGVPQQVSIANISMDQGNGLSQDFPIEQQRSNLQQPNVSMSGFGLQPVYNQQPVLQPDRPFLQDNRLNQRDGLLPTDQSGNFLPPNADARFRPVESQHVTNMNFGPPDHLIQRPHLQSPQSPFLPEHFARGNGPTAHPREPFFHQDRPRGFERTPMFPDHVNFRPDAHSPFTGNQNEHGRQDLKQNFQTQQSQEDTQAGDNNYSARSRIEPSTDHTNNYKQSDQQSTSSRSQATHDSSQAFQDLERHQSDRHEFPNSQRRGKPDVFPDESVIRGGASQNGSFLGNNADQSEQPGREQVRPRFTHPNQQSRYRFRPSGSNIAMRGPRPQRMVRPPRFQHQRPRLRPPAPRPRIPQGYMPRRPIF